MQIYVCSMFKSIFLEEYCLYMNKFGQYLMFYLIFCEQKLCPDLKALHFLCWWWLDQLLDSYLSFSCSCCIATNIQRVRPFTFWSCITWYICSNAYLNTGFHFNVPTKRLFHRFNMHQVRKSLRLFLSSVTQIISV